MRICYLLEDTSLWGGVKVVFEQAEALRRRGHEVTILSKGDRPDWFELSVPLNRVGEFSASTIPNSDFVIATYWSTVRQAIDAGRGRPVHLCQGYEGDFAGLSPQVEEIEAVYRMAALTLTVHEPITRLLRERFGKAAHTVGEGVDSRVFFPGPLRQLCTPPRILLVGPWEVDWKGVREGVAALSRVRDELPMHVVRASQYPQGEEERRMGVVDEYHTRLLPSAMVDLYRSCDLFVAPSWAQEGFGLPLLEALACGVPTAARAIPSFLAFAPGDDWTVFFPEREAGGMERAIRRLLIDADLRAHLRARGLAVAREYSYQRVAERIERILSAEAGK